MQYQTDTTDMHEKTSFKQKAHHFNQTNTSYISTSSKKTAQLFGF